MQLSLCMFSSPMNTILQMGAATTTAFSGKGKTELPILLYFDDDSSLKTMKLDSKGAKLTRYAEKYKGDREEKEKMVRAILDVESVSLDARTKRLRTSALDKARSISQKTGGKHYRALTCKPADSVSIQKDSA